VRYIGNKTKLLEFIGAAVDQRGIAPGTAVDPFSGTASVASELKRRGFRVLAADIMEYAYVLARASVEVARTPRCPALRDALDLPDESIDAVVAWLNAQPPAEGFIYHHYTPGGPFGRMYFTTANGARIDGMRATLEGWRTAGLIDRDAFHVLLAALIEAADRVANTTGVYAAFVKTWQPNAIRAIELRTPAIVEGAGSRAELKDALAVVAELEPFDLLYLDPPYNSRQYAGYYHIPEVIAAGWFDKPPATRGKTGLIADHDKRSDWSRTGRCEAAFERLVATAPWQRLVMSYNTEGIIPQTTIERVLRQYGRAATYERRELPYRRYRSDADGKNRRYRGDRVTEYLYCVDR
jgi:adenine-specific DNA-methyltransferase